MRNSIRETKDQIVIGSRTSSHLAESACESVSCQLVKHTFRDVGEKGRRWGGGR